MSDLPCKNQSCSSYGKPHPNCQCYGGMADGGDVKDFCALTQAHKKECKYFAEGGESDDDSIGKSSVPEFIPDKQFQPDIQHSVQADGTPDFVPDEKFAADQHQDFVPEDEFTPDTDEHGGIKEQLLTAAEGAAQGFAGPFATAAEKGLSKLGVPDLTDQDIKAREEENPWTHGVGETAGLGASLAMGPVKGLVFAAGKLLPHSIPLLGKVGAAAIKAFAVNSAIGAGNETTKAMLGQGDPDHAVASALANVGINGLIGGIFEGGSAALASTEAKIGSKAASWLAGIGAKASGVEEKGLTEKLGSLSEGLQDPKAFQSGYKNYDKLVSKGTDALATGPVLGTAFYLSTPIGVAGLLGYDFIRSALKGIIKKPVESLSKTIMPTVTKWLSEGAPSKLLPLLNYATKVEQGNKLINNSVSTLFKGGNQQVTKYLDRERRRLDDWISDGGIDQDIQDEQQGTQNTEGYAKGGEVKKKEPQGILHDHPIAIVYPEQNMMLQTAKGRISNYLRSLKPQEHSARLAFDAAPDQREQDRSYHRALDIAISPLSVLDHVNKGTIEPEHIKHFNALYPELNTILQKKLTEHITHAQLNDEKPSYKIRQGLSMLLGTPLSSELTPQNIQAAQAVFKSQQQQQQQAAPAPTKNKRSTSTLSKSSQSFLTGNQSLMGRQQKQ